MARERISLVPEEVLQEEKIRYKIANDLLSNEEFNQLNPEDQNKVKRVLFEMYANPVVAPVAFSGLEFAIFGLGKLFFKLNSGDELTEEERVFYDRFKTFIEKHEITMDAGDWYVSYAEEAMLLTQNNREEYKQKKIGITGYF